MKMLSIVLPVFNEKLVLEKLYGLLESKLALLKYSYEIIFINDGSTDGSQEVLEKFCQKNKNVKLVNFSRNFGHQYALIAGLEHSAGDAVILMDSDLQDSPDIISKFIQKWEEGYEVVYAVRKSRKESIFFKFFFSAFYRLLSFSSRFFIPKDSGIFSLIDRRVVREIIGLEEYNIFIPGLRAWAGFKQTGILIDREGRYDNKPRVGFFGLIRLAVNAIFSFSTLPLHIFLYLGITMFFAGSIGILIILYLRIFTILDVPGWASTMTIVTLSSSLNLLFLGVVGEYVSKIFDEVKRRPRYIVKNVINIDKELCK